MTGPTIRVADEHDVLMLAALRSQWETEKRTSDDPGFEAAFRNWFDAERHHRVFWIALLDEQPVGMVNLMLFDRMPTPGKASGGWGYLGNMYVQESVRNGGVGGQLVLALLDEADRLGLERVVLRPTDRARPFYARRGFVAADDLLLVRPLSR